MKIVCLKNGPYLVTDDTLSQVTNEDDTVDALKVGPIALCRCGHSAAKPFCDGKHKAMNFEAEQVELNERIGVS